MEITESALTAQYQRASFAWPFIHQAELACGLPRMLLFAAGSRETNLTSEVGDFGHGHGVWQLDDRSHTPPGGFARRCPARGERISAGQHERTGTHHRTREEP